MPDRQSVIERLNGIHAVACGLGNDQCYLNGISIKQLVMLINDATELLKAQEPRLLSVDELHALPKETPVWLEHRHENGQWDIYYDASNGQAYFRIENEYGIGCLSIEDYGICWRVWTSCPTDAQRESVPWWKKEET